MVVMKQRINAMSPKLKSQVNFFSPSIFKNLRGQALVGLQKLNGGNKEGRNLAQNKKSISQVS